MVRVLSITSLALAAVSAVSGLVVPRQSAPNGWQTEILEPYQQYHDRYIALDCQGKHGQAFFNQCCHPLLATETLDSLPPQCNPDDCRNDTSSTTSSTTHPSSPKVTPKPAPAVAPEPSSSTSSSPKPKPTPASGASSDGSQVNTGGQATFFYQGGAAGACGQVHSDNDLICAMDQARYGNSGNASPLCGKQVKITNTQNGKTVTVTVADDCPTCLNSNSIDLSVAAFKTIADESQGVAPISWSFV